MKESKYTTDAYGRVPDNPNDGPDESYYRRRSYEKYFEGYTTYQVIQPDGTKKAYREYTGPIYRQDYDSAQLTRRKVGLAALLLAALVLHFGAQFFNIPSNRSWYISFSAMIPMVFLVVCAFSLGTYLGAGAELKIREFREGVTRLSRMSRYAAISSAAPILTTILMFILQPGSFRTLDLLRFAMFGLSAAGAFMLSKLSEDIKYTICESQKPKTE